MSEPLSELHDGQEKMESSALPLLEVKGLSTRFVGKRKTWWSRPPILQAVDQVDLQLWPGQTLALVGESGCGKTTLGRSILGLVTSQGGVVRLLGEELNLRDAGALRRLRRQVQMVFQDPLTSLDPKLRVLDLVGEGLLSFGLVKNSQELVERVSSLLQEVGLGVEALYRFPHEFSGGQRQRIGIARALAVEPKLIICDEAVSALDVSIQAQILNLLARLQAERGVSYLFITHNLSVVRYLAHQVAVMYLGKVVELAPKAQLFEAPAHPYTRGLLASVPGVDPMGPRLRAQVQGELPSPWNPPPGCRFQTRCPYKTERCVAQEPELRAWQASQVACHHPLSGLRDLHAAPESSSST